MRVYKGENFGNLVSILFLIRKEGLGGGGVHREKRKGGNFREEELKVKFSFGYRDLKITDTKSYCRGNPIGETR